MIKDKEKFGEILKECFVVEKNKTSNGSNLVPKKNIRSLWTSENINKYKNGNAYKNRIKGFIRVDTLKSGIVNCSNLVPEWYSGFKKDLYDNLIGDNEVTGGDYQNVFRRGLLAVTSYNMYRNADLNKLEIEKKSTGNDQHNEDKTGVPVYVFSDNAWGGEPDIRTYEGRLLSGTDQILSVDVEQEFNGYTSYGISKENLIDLIIYCIQASESTDHTKWVKNFRTMIGLDEDEYVSYEELQKWLGVDEKYDAFKVELELKRLGLEKKEKYNKKEVLDIARDKGEAVVLGSYFNERKYKKEKEDIIKTIIVPWNINGKEYVYKPSLKITVDTADNILSVIGG